MKPILLLALGGAAVWLLVQNKQSKQVNRVFPQDQRGITRFQPKYSAQMPAQVHAAWVTPPGASRQGGYVPAFGPFADQIDPNSLYFNQA